MKTRLVRILAFTLSGGYILFRGFMPSQASAVQPIPTQIGLALAGDERRCFSEDRMGHVRNKGSGRRYHVQGIHPPLSLLTTSVTCSPGPVIFI